MIVNASALRLPLADDTVDAALCSPPYWGALRVYEGPQSRPWPAISYSPMPGLPPVDVPAQAVPLGHEPDPFAFVGHLLQVFREVRRVLVPGGCLAVNLGDVYSSSPSGQNGRGGSSLNCTPDDRFVVGSSPGRQDRSSCGLAPKNLTLIPWRFALAMQADGWTLRSRMPGGVEVLPGLDVGIEPDIVWRKPSCMPESVRDRPTVDFEDVLLFSQGSRYFFDQEAGREQSKSVWNSAKGFSESGQRKRQGVPGQTYGKDAEQSGRNMRSSWTMSPEPTDEEHFAAWPVALAARLIRVLTSERGRCPECGAPWVRQVERQRCLDGKPTEGLPAWSSPVSPRRMNDGIGHARITTRVTENGWAPSCAHDVEPVPCLVLDPFAGIGRTCEAARETGRRFVGTDLGLGYCRLALSRNDMAAMARRRAAESQKVRTITGPLFGDA